MKSKKLILSLLFIASLGFAQTKAIQFETTSFAEIKAKAKKANKLIFIDAYTTWCGPCKWMAANTFTNDTVADYFNSKFINAQIDMEKGEGPAIAKLYEVSCYPTLLFIDGEGNLIHRGAGALKAQEFIKLAEDSFNPEKRFSKFKTEYASKKTDPNFLSEFLTVLSKTCLKVDDVLNDYFKTQKDEDLANRKNWNIIKEYSSNYKSREFVYLLNHTELYNKAYSADSVSSKIKEVFLNSGYSIIYKKGMKEADYNAYIAEIKKINFSAVDEVVFKLDMAYAEKKQDWKKYTELAVEKGDIYFHSIRDYNSICWTIYEHSDDQTALLTAKAWMRKALMMDTKEAQEWYVYDTYAAVLFKLKEKEEAKAVALKAIELAKAVGLKEEEYKSTIELLKKIEELK